MTMKNNIQKFLNEKGFTRIELSSYLQKKKLGVSRQALHAYCHNISQPQNGAVRRAICEFLKEKITNVFIYNDDAVDNPAKNDSERTTDAPANIGA